MFLSTLDEEAWQSFLSEFNQRVENKAKVDDGGEVLRASSDRHWTGREKEERAAEREDDWPKEAEVGYRSQPMYR